jgi:hypothetical protein
MITKYLRSKCYLGFKDRFKSRIIAQAFNFDDYLINQKPTHININNLKPNFLEWFVGFAEGDGSFYVKNEKNGPRVIFEVSQKYPQPLYRIKKELGFGTVRKEIRANGQVYWKFIIESKSNIPRIAALFNGNLILPKRRVQFEKWIEVSKQTNCLPHDYFNKQSEVVKIIQANQENETILRALYKNDLSLISLKNGWLAGFIDAEGCFSASYRAPNPKNYQRARITSRMHLTQKSVYGDKFVLERIGELLQSKANVLKVNNQHTFDKAISSYYRIDMHSIKTHSVLIEYFKNYRLYTSKIISYRRWERIINAILLKKHLDPLQLPRLQRLCKSINRKESDLGI